MGTLQEESKKARYARIIELCDERPRTVVELANELNMSYYTLRKDTLALVETEQLSIAPAGIHGKTAFTTGRARRFVPMIRVEASGQFVPVFTISDAYKAAVEAGGNRTVEAVLGVLQIAADLCHKSYFMSQGGSIEPKHLAELRRTLAEHKKFLDSTSAIAQQMLDNYILWDPESLSKMILDEEWNGERMEDNYQYGLEAQAEKQS